MQLGTHAFTIPDEEPAEPDSDDEDAELPSGIPRMVALDCRYPSSVYSSSSDEYESRNASPIPEDSNSKLLFCDCNSKAHDCFFLLQFSYPR